MGYLVSKVHLLAREEQYRAYIATCAQLIAESTAKFAGGKTLKQSYMDIIQRQSKQAMQPQKAKKEERSPEQIAADILDALHK